MSNGDTQSRQRFQKAGQFVGLAVTAFSTKSSSFSAVETDPDALRKGAIYELRPNVPTATDEVHMVTESYAYGQGGEGRGYYDGHPLTSAQRTQIHYPTNSQPYPGYGQPPTNHPNYNVSSTVSQQYQIPNNGYPPMAGGYGQPAPNSTRPYYNHAHNSSQGYPYNAVPHSSPPPQSGHDPYNTTTQSPPNYNPQDQRPGMEQRDPSDGSYNSSSSGPITPGQYESYGQRQYGAGNGQSPPPRGSFLQRAATDQDDQRHFFDDIPGVVRSRTMHESTQFGEPSMSGYAA